MLTSGSAQYRAQRRLQLRTACIVWLVPVKRVYRNSAELLIINYATQILSVSPTLVHYATPAQVQTVICKEGRQRTGGG
jgi:hypothetical protein